MTNTELEPEGQGLGLVENLLATWSISSLLAAPYNFFICPMSEDARNAQCPPVREVRATLGNIRGRDLNMEILGGKIYICFTEW